MEVARSFKRAVRGQFRARGLDIVRYPWPGSLAQHLALLFAAYSVNVVLDVGANSGEYAELMRSIGYAGLIVSFEPAADAFKRLSAAACRDPHWIAVNTALGATERAGALTVYEDDVLSSFRQPVQRDDFRLEFGFDLMPSLKAVREETVPIRALDNVMQELAAELPAQPHVYLKMDTQGFDLEVFDGCRRFRKNVVGLQSEVSYQPIYQGMPSAQEAIAEFKEAGFVESGFFPVHHDDRLRAVEFDCVMVRGD